MPAPVDIRLINAWCWSVLVEVSGARHQAAAAHLDQARPSSVVHSHRWMAAPLGSIDITPRPGWLARCVDAAIQAAGDVERPDINQALG
jgi:hypothetical protein